MNVGCLAFYFGLFKFLSAMFCNFNVQLFHLPLINFISKYFVHFDSIVND